MDTGAHLKGTRTGTTAGANVTVWAGLVSITAIEVFLAGKGLRPGLLLGLLVLLPVAQAILLVSCFMRLRFRKSQPVFWLLLIVVFCIGLMVVFSFPDSVRLLQMRQ